MRIWLGLLPLAFLPMALGQAPSFRADRVLPSGAGRPAPLAPGMLISIYGEGLGPASPCSANADPLELCEVQVSLAGLPAGLLYVSEKQINFKVPRESPVRGDAELKVVYQGRAGAVKMRVVALDWASLSVEGEARVGAPLWIRIDMPFGGSMVQYPVNIQPGNFGCNEFQVRRNGSPLPRLAVRSPTGGITMGGPPCGNIGIEGSPIPHTGRLPLHLQYRFAQPGLYEVRYTRRGMDNYRDPSRIMARSEWTPIHVLPRAPGPRAIRPAPTDAAELLSDYLPNALGFSDAARLDAAGLDAVIACLYHANQTVRQFASMALVYWPKDEADARVDRALTVRGPSEPTIDGTLLRHPEMLPLVLPYLKSDDLALLRGAVIGVSRWLYAHPAQGDAGAALIDAAAHVTRTADPQTVVYYASALGSVRDPRAGTLLWNMAQRRGVAQGQALIAITWRKDARDLPRLTALMEAPVTGDPMNTELSSLPYALRNSYGEAALPYLESALTKSESVWVRTNCARELIQAGRPSGFAFVAQAIEEEKPYAREMTQFVQERFPELRAADDAAVLAFLKKR